MACLFCLYIFGLDASTGSLNYTCNNSNANTNINGVTVDALGNVIIYDCVYLGNNSSIKEKLSIHSLTTIGMNGAVVKHIEEPGTYVGVPVKKLK